jgi:biopolymer transport protein ExbB/TolQ
MRQKRLKTTFLTTMVFFLVIFSLFTLTKNIFFSSYDDSEYDKTFDHIEQQLSELKEMKDSYEIIAIKHENQAEKFQEIKKNASKKHYKLAKANRSISRKLQKDIEDLEKRKDKILIKTTNN